MLMLIRIGETRGKFILYYLFSVVEIYIRFYNMLHIV